MPLLNVSSSPSPAEVTTVLNFVLMIQLYFLMFFKNYLMYECIPKNIVLPFWTSYKLNYITVNHPWLAFLINMILEFISVEKKISQWYSLNFFFSFFLFLLFLAALCGLWDPSFPTRDWSRALAVKVPSPNHWTAREFLLWLFSLVFCFIFKNADFDPLNWFHNGSWSTV